MPPCDGLLGSSQYPHTHVHKTYRSTSTVHSPFPSTSAKAHVSQHNRPSSSSIWAKHISLQPPKTGSTTRLEDYSLIVGDSRHYLLCIPAWSTSCEVQKEPVLPSQLQFGCLLMRSLTSPILEPLNINSGRKPWSKKRTTSGLTPPA